MAERKRSKPIAAKAKASRNNGATTTPRAKPAPPIASRFQPGNPGRPKGSRNKLGEAFLEALHGDFETHGAVAIQRTRDEDPAAYVRVIASLLPKELKIETVSDLTDEQLDARIRQLASALEIGIGGSAGGAAAKAEPNPTKPLSPLH